MPQSTVPSPPIDTYVDQAQRRAFTRRAIAAFHKGVEYMEALLVRRDQAGFHVVQFIRLTLTKQEEGIVECAFDEYYALRARAIRQGYQFATVHTHTYGDSAPSEWDHRDSVEDGDCLVGVCFIWKDEKTGRTKSRIDFWQPQVPCNLKVIHSK